MTTLDDLRSTLAAHAAGEDSGLAGRAASVHTRVQVVRRRRRVSAVVGAVAAVVLVAAGIALPRLSLDDSRGDFAGLLPETVTFNGFSYRFASSSEFEGAHGRIGVGVSGGDPTVAVLAAEGLGRGTVTLLDADGEPLERLIGDGASAPILLGPAARGKQAMVTLEVAGAPAHARVGVASYRRTAAMPPGVVDRTGSTVFRERVGGRTLDTAAFLDGAAEKTFTFRGSLADVRIAGYCAVPGGRADGDGPSLFVDVDGNGYVGSTCGSASEDAFGGATWQQDDHDDRLHTLRVWTATRQDGEPVAVPGAVAGAAVYTGGETVQVHGSTIDRVVEFSGRLWRLDRVVEGRPGTDRIEASWSRLSDHLLVGYAVEGTRRVSTGGTVPAGGSTDRTADSAAETHSSSLSGVVLPGSDQRFTVGWPARYADASGAILLYRPLP